MPDPIGALQNLARQGTGNNTNMGMQGPSPNPQAMGPQQPPGATNANNRKCIFKTKLNSIYIFII